MKILKQILHKHCDMPEYYRYQNEINAFKEWLQQNKKFLIDTEDERPINEFAISYIFDGLLEELE